ncbi:MAG: arginine--tRNA ligase [Pseudomonadota bacterium]
MNLFADIRDLVVASIEALSAEGAIPADLNLSAIAVEPPRDAAHGDMATNAAMALAKSAKVKPRDLAAMLAPKLEADPRIETAEIAGPGFINLRLASSIWLDALKTAVVEGAAFGRGTSGEGKRVNVEYVSANPTGPLHVGHTRGAVFGDALASLLAFAGWDVTREYYINDGGAQVDTLARSAHLRYQEAHGREIELVEGLYPGDDIVAVGEALKDEFGDSLLDKPEADWLQTVRDFATDRMMDMIRADLASLGVKMDHFYSEKSLYAGGRIEAALASLDEKGLIYTGTLPPPKGKLPEDWEEREQTLFRSTDYGDDVDRPVKKSDGSWTYFAPDIAYHYDKVERGYDHLIDVFGADHGGYVKRMKAAVAALSEEKTPLDIKLVSLVKLFKDGAELKMSKRAGTVVNIRDVVEGVGPDVARFTMLTRKNDAPFDFDFDKALEQSKDNPVFYVQYAHARIASVLRSAAEQGIDVGDAALGEADLSALSHEAWTDLARKVAEWPRLAETAALHHEPHRVAFYLYDLASVFHALWNRGREASELRFLQDEDQAGAPARLAAIRSVQVVIATGLGILGVTPATKM